jgi:glycosyltransferase involved in cell wall biosynthesis
MLPLEASMRVAVVHEWMVSRAGSERVLEAILEVVPDADLYSIADFLPPTERAFLKGRAVRTSFIQHLPMARRRHRLYLPLAPLAAEQIDLSAYDLVISSSHAVAKGVISRPGQLHLSYVYTPSRYAWDLQEQYLRQSELRGLRSAAARLLLHYFRLWDVCAANRVDSFATLSHFVAQRIRKTYRREAQVIYPPVDVDGFSLSETKDDFYLTVSRLVPYKRIDLLVDAFTRMPRRKLVVIGDGPELKRIRARAGANVTLMGHQPFEVVRDRMQRARAFIFAAEEDFGIAPLEAQACGTPVIAYGRGGTTETIVEAETGLFFYEQSAEAVTEVIERFERSAGAFDPRACRRNAERFRPERFRKEFRKFLDEEWAGFRGEGSSQSAARGVNGALREVENRPPQT